MFLMEHSLLTFPLNYQNVYDYQTFQDGDMLQRAAAYLNGVVLWGHVTNKMHISTCRKCVGTITLGKVLT